MWLENKKYREIRTALHSGASSELDRVLHDIVEKDQDVPKAPTRCPVCHKELKRGTLPYLEFFGAACPDFHGWWLSPEISKKLRDFIRDQISIGMKKARQFKMLTLFLAGIAGLFFLNHILPKPQQAPSKMSEIIFLLPMPVHSSAVQSEAEWTYFLNSAGILEDGIANRMNFEQALKTTASSEEQWKAFSLYREKQEQLIEKLRAMAVPEKLQEFNHRLSQIFENQIVFYAKAMENKGQAIVSMIHQDLTAAFDLILKAYPTLDPQTRTAFQERLFSLASS